MEMIRRYATLTLFLGLPRGSITFITSQNVRRIREGFLRPSVLRASTRLGGRQLHFRRRRSDSLVASLSTGNRAQPYQQQQQQQQRSDQTERPLPPIQSPSRRPLARKRLTSTGGLKFLPIVTPSVELLSHANRKSKKVPQDMLIKNARNRSRKWVAERMDTLGKSVSKPLRDVVRRYRQQLPILHPFEATLADLTVRAREKSGKRTLQAVLDDVNEFRKVALEISKSAARKGKLGEKKTEIMGTMDDGYSQMGEHFACNGMVLEELTEVQKALRGLPIVQLHIPTVVLVGAPNVGKSSIIRAVSTGTPEVNSYPFTTRGMALGHMFHPETKAQYQIMDTPGVLSRPDDARNEMEALTLASMQHLPTAVVFVMDLSGYSGLQSSLENQIEVRNELRRRFPRRPWLDVVSKADIPRYGLDRAVEALPDGFLDVSTHDGTGIDMLKERLFEMYEIIEGILTPSPDVEE